MEDGKCDTCEANEELLKILTQRIMWIEEILMAMTDNKSMEYLNVSNDIKKTIKHNVSSKVQNMLFNERNKIRDEIKNKLCK